MSFPFGPNALTLSDLAKQLRMTFQTFTDKRRGKNTRYTIEDAALSAFSVFFMQSPSFLEYQRTMQEAHVKSNAQTLFGVHQIPTDNHIRDLLDEVEAPAVYPMFSYIFQGLDQAGVLDSYRAVGNTLLLAPHRHPLLFLPEDSLSVLFDAASWQRPGDVLPHGVDAGPGQARSG